MDRTLSNGLAVRLLTAGADIQPLADVLFEQAKNPVEGTVRMPAGYANTDQQRAWFTVAERAVNWGVAVAAFTAGGVIDAYVVAHDIGADQCAIDEQGGECSGELVTIAQEAAAAKGRTLGRMVERLVDVPTLVQVFEPV